MSYKFDYLISWFHPTEYCPELAIPYWVTGRNEDFGFETRCAVVRAVDSGAAMELIRSHYDLPGFTLTFRFCKLSSNFAPAFVPITGEVRAA